MEDLRMFSLSSDDTEYLCNTFPHWETISGQWLLIHGFPVCDGYTSNLVTAAIQIPSTQKIFTDFSSIFTSAQNIAPTPFLPDLKADFTSPITSR